MSTSMKDNDALPDDIEWVKFWETPGILAAEVVAGRLRAEGVPAWVWQQSAGTAMGLIYGPMGRGHVMVPEDLLEAARQVMNEDLSIAEEGSEELPEDSEENEKSGWLAKGILALTALAVSPLGVAAAFIVARLFGGREEFDAICPDCQTAVDLDEVEIRQGWYVCPACKRTVFLEK